MKAKKNNNSLRFYLLIIGLSILPTIPFFVSHDLLHTHDGLVHLPRLAAFFQAITELHFPVRWAGYLNYGYGMPLFNFIYQFPYYIGSIFLSFGFGLVNSFKVSLTLSFVLSGIGMLAFTRAFFKDDYKALFVTSLYQFAPFRMVELLVRGSYGEVYTYALFPFVLFGLAKYKEQMEAKYFVLTSIFTAFLITTHNSVSLLFFGALCLYVLLTTGNVRKIFFLLLPLITGLLLSTYYWAPALVEHKYTYGNLYMKDLYKSHFVPVWKFFAPNFNNVKALQTEGISTFLGVFQIFGIISSLYLLVFKRKTLSTNIKGILYFSFVLFAVSFFFMLPISKFIWEASFAAFLRQFQFPWRFLALITVATAFMGISILEVFPVMKKRESIFIAVFLIVLSVAFFWKASEGYRKIDEEYYKNFPLNTTYYGETDVIWSAGPAKSYPKQRVELIGGEGRYSNFEKKNSYQKFTISNSTDTQLVSHTQYFPGWRAYVDGHEVAIQFQDPNNRGELTFLVPKGEHTVVLKFGESKIRMIADILSLVSLVALFPLSFLIKKFTS